jgi:hypothetical protein
MENFTSCPGSRMIHTDPPSHEARGTISSPKWERKIDFWWLLVPQTEGTFECNHSRLNISLRSPRSKPGSSFPFPTSSLPHWETRLNHFYALFLPLVAHFPIMQHLSPVRRGQGTTVAVLAAIKALPGSRFCPTHVLAGFPCAVPR